MSTLETPSGKSPSFTSMERGRKSGVPILQGEVRIGKGQKRHAQHQRLTPDEMGNQREKTLSFPSRQVLTTVEKKHNSTTYGFQPKKGKKPRAQGHPSNDKILLFDPNRQKSE